MHALQTEQPTDRQMTHTIYIYAYFDMESIAVSAVFLILSNNSIIIINKLNTFWKHYELWQEDGDQSKH